MTAVRKSRSPRNSQLAEGVGKRGYLIRQSTNGPSHPEICWAKGVTEKWLSAGTVKARRPHQMLLVKLGVNKGGR